MTEQFKIEDRDISGDIQLHSKNSVEQGTAEEFLAAIDAVLAFPEVKKIRWEQFTPYFNDGDPCEFNVHEPAVKFTGHLKQFSEQYSDYGDGYLDAWNLKYRAEKDKFSLPEGLVEALSAVSSSRFESVCRSNFGEHARVTASRKGFKVEFYKHD